MILAFHQKSPMWLSVGILVICLLIDSDERINKIIKDLLGILGPMKITGKFSKFFFTYIKNKICLYMKCVCGTYLIKTKQLNSVFVYFPLTTPTVFCEMTNIVLFDSYHYRLALHISLLIYSSIRIHPRSFLSNK